MTDDAEASGGAEAPLLVLVGERVALGPLRRELVPLYHRWEQDLVVMAGLGQTAPETLDARYGTYEQQESRGGLSAANFTVYAKTAGGEPQPVGLIWLQIYANIWVADFTIIVGERRGEGLGTEASRLALDWAFNVAGLHNVKLDVWVPNAPAIRAYEKAGFKRIGVRRNSGRWLGRQCDVLLMDAVPEDLPHSVVPKTQ